MSLFRGGGLMRPESSRGAAGPVQGVAGRLARRSLQKQFESTPTPTHTPPPPPQPQAPAYVMYFKPKCTPCRRMLRTLAENRLSTVFVQNIWLLAHLPPWLDGTPILADTRLGVIYRGTDAQVFLDKLISAAMAPPPPLPITQTPPESPIKEQKTKMKPSLFTLDTDDITSVDDRSGDKLSEDSIQALMAQRKRQQPGPPQKRDV